MFLLKGCGVVKLVNRDTNDYCFDSLHQYLGEISKYPLLSLEEEKMYFERYAGANGSEKEEIRNFIAQHNLKLVVFNAKRFRNLGVDFLDLIQTGNFGLLEAIDKFDYQKGYRFSTYATWWIKQKMHQAVDKSGVIYIPIETLNLIKKVNEFEEAFEFSYKRNPTLSETTVALHLSKEKLLFLKNCSSSFVSLSEKLNVEESDLTYEDMLVDDFCLEEVVEKKFVLEEIRRLLKEDLTYEEYALIVLRFGFVDAAINPDGMEHTLKEIGQILGSTLDAVRWSEKKIKKILHTKMLKRGL